MSRKTNLASASLLLALLLPLMAWAVPAAGTITHLGGVLQVTRADGATRLLAVRSEVFTGDTLRTEKGTYARIRFSDGGEVVLRPETVFKIERYQFSSDAGKAAEDGMFMRLLKGGLRAVTGLIGKRDHERYKLNTVTATIGIRGTHFGALLCNNDCANIPTISGGPPANGLHTDTASGSTVISNAAGSVVVPAGSFSFTPGPMAAPLLVPPSQGIQVTLPLVISSNKAAGRGGVGSKGDNACSVGGQ